MTEEIDHSKVKVIPLKVHNVKTKLRISDFQNKLIKALQDKVDQLTKEKKDDKICS